MRTLLLAFATALTLAAAPSITGVVNGASNIPPGLPNSGIAQGSIIVIYGSGLGPATLVQATTFPLPSTLGLAGTTASATVGSVTTTCILFYTSASQVAVLIPSATPAGAGTLSVSYQGQSASLAVQVVASGWGTIALNSSGTGPAVVTDANYNPITMTYPGNPGQTVILWGTGLGPVTGDETEPPVQVDLGTGVQVFVENQPATVFYGGRSGSPGLDQINFAIPSGISGGCRTSILVIEKGVVANVTTMAIAPPGQSTCSDSTGILNSTNLQKAATSGTFNTAGVTLYRFGSNSDFLAANFDSYPTNLFVRSYGGSLGASIGSCTAYESLGSSVIIDPMEAYATHLDSGANLVFSGPDGAKTIAASAAGAYSTTLGASASYINPGTFTVNNGNGGAAVGAFSSTLTLPAAIAITNFPSVINRAQDLTVTWSNSSAFNAVSIFGVSGVPLASGTTAYVQFYCTAAASAGQFTIPAQVLQLLPTNGFGATGQSGAALEIAGIAGTGFTASGLDAGVFDAFSYTGKVLKVQ